MQAILRSRVSRGRYEAGVPVRIEVSASLNITEADCTRNGRFDKEMAQREALAEFMDLFGEPLIRLATTGRAVWTIEVI